MVVLRDFPKIMVHEVWVGNIRMTPGVCLFVCVQFNFPGT